MGTSFDSVLLDIAYSAEASGGAEWATAIVRSGQGGVIAQRNINREDFISRYEIEYLVLSKERRVALRNFATLRQGMARGFRFLPPDDYSFLSEPVGELNSVTGEIELSTGTDGVTSRFFTIRHYADETNNYTRWIIKMSPLDDMNISIAPVTNPTNSVADGDIPGGYISNRLPAARSVVLGNPFGAVTIYYDLGIIQFTNPPPEGYIITVSGVYHLPVVFTDDWQKFKIDETSIGEYKIALEEVLPVELGISPGMILPSTDNEPPTIPTGLAGTVISNSQINLTWNASTDNVAVAGYEIEVT